MGERAPPDEDERTRASAVEHEAVTDHTNASADGGALAGAGDPLVVWALAAFHTAGLVTLLVASLFLAGPLGELLGGLDTLLGLALFVVLWAITWWTNRRWLSVVADPETDASASVVVGTGGKWGGVNGVCFFWVLFGGIVLLNAGDFSLAGVLYVLVAGAIGSLLALGIGAIFGSLFAALDVALFRAADRLVPPPDEGD